jgi:hypothetical protein
VLFGCATAERPKELPAEWKQGKEYPACSSLDGVYDAHGEGVEDNPQFSNLQPLPGKGILPSLLKNGENRPVVEDIGAVQINGHRENAFDFVFVKLDGHLETVTIDNVQWHCANGQLVSRWTEAGTGTGGVWVHEARTVSLYKATDGALIVMSAAAEKQIQPIVLIPVYSQWKIRFYWRFLPIQELPPLLH